MKLIEKFNNLVPSEFGGMQEPLLTECVGLADKHALGFLRYVLANQDNDRLSFYSTIQKGRIMFPPEKLLEIYKEAKGL